MLDVNLSCVLLLVHFSAAHLLCTNLDMASVVPNRALLEPWEVRFFFLKLPLLLLQLFQRQIASRRSRQVKTPF